jgi:uncharacterized protein
MIEPRLIVLQPAPYCNINCSYCYLGHRDDRRLMSDDIIEAIREKIILRLRPTTAPAVVWHAGEPTAAPIAWYEHAYDRLASVAPPHTSFAMQTNGIAVDGRWIDLFRRTNTNVSVSIDGPQRFHDLRRRTRNDKPTWVLAVRGLRRLQSAGFDPRVITVLHPDCLDGADEFFSFYRDHGITQVSFSIDEFEGANRVSSFAESDHKAEVTKFLVALMEGAYRDGFPLHVREVERVAHILAGAPVAGNEQVEPWASIVVAADGSVSTFSPEFMEVTAPQYGNFVFGNIVQSDFEDFTATEAFVRTKREVAAGIAACRSSCRYFEVCGGGSPVNKFCEKGDLRTTETEFCRLSTQASADALLQFLNRRAPNMVWSPPTPDATGSVRETVQSGSANTSRSTKRLDMKAPD